jgi:raffinose/stachyose/melibiose transport system permease protein
VIIPFLINIGVSFTRWSGVGTPTWIGLANYQKAAADSTFWASFKNNMTLILAMTVIPTLVGLFLAVVLFDYVARKFGKGVAGFFRAGYYLPQVLPAVMAGVVWGWILFPTDAGSLNWLLKSLGITTQPVNWLGDAATAMISVMVVMVWFQIGYPLVIFMAGLQRVDPELGEAAEIDGASWLQRFAYVTIPQLRPEIFVVVLTTMIHALKVFGQIFVLTRGGPGSATMVASYFAYKNFFEISNVGYGSTIATILTLIIIVITIVYIRVQARQEPQESL